jgi:hypothetical protein
MKNKIKQILLDTLNSPCDNGNIDDGGIIGGDNAVEQLYDLFVDEMTAIDTAIISPNSKTDDYKEHVKSIRSAKIPLNNKFSPTTDDILYTNPKTGKAQKLFDTLESVYGIRCSETITIGDKGCSVSMNVSANSEEEAIAKVMKAKEFTKHIRMKDFDKKYLSVYRPVGNYVIGKVEYYEGDERL